MLEHRVLCYLLMPLLGIFVCQNNVFAAGGVKRPPGSGHSLPGSRYEPVAQGSDSTSQVEYVNDGPLGPLYDFLIQNRLQRLCLLLRKAGLEQYLLNAGYWTIFAPTDSSFAFLPGGTLEDLEKNPQLLRDFLLHHFVAGDLALSQVLDEMVVDSLQGAPLKFNIYGPPDVTTVNGAEILQADLQFDLGRVHIIDRPLYPLPNYDLLGYLQVYHSELYKLIVNAGLTDYLTSGTFTIFAPDDKAFDYLSLELKDALATNETLAQNVVLTHVLPASMFVRGFTNGMHMNSVGNADLLFTQRRGLTFVNGIPILSPDLPVTNGVIHVVNRVLLPEGVDADCHCKPLDSKRGVQIIGGPYESSRISPTPRPQAPSRVTAIRPATPTAATGPRPVVPSIITTSRRTSSQQTILRPGSAPSVGQRQPVVPAAVPGQRPTSAVLSGTGERPSSGTGIVLPQQPALPAVSRPGQSQITITTTRQIPGSPAAQVPVKRKPFNPNRIPTTRPTVSTFRPGIPPADTLVIDLTDDFEGAAAPGAPESPVSGTQAQRPGVSPAVRPSVTVTSGRRQVTSTVSRIPAQPVPQARQPAHTQIISTHRVQQQVSRPQGVPSFEDNTLDIQSGQYPDYEYETLTQRPGQQRPFQPVPGRRPAQPGQRPGQSQPTQRPIQRPVQRPIGQPGRRPGQQPGLRPGTQQIIPTTVTPGSSSGRRPGPSQVTRRPSVPVVPPTPRAPSYPSASGRRGATPAPAPGQPQDFVPGRTTSLFPTRRPGQSSHSTKGQTYDPQRHNPQRRQPSRSAPPQSSRQTSTVTTGAPARQQFQPNRQSPTCRRRSERITPATQSLPICPDGDNDFQPCQRVDEPYNPSDPRPICSNIPELINCREQGQLSEPTDNRPLCSEVEVRDCRLPGERPLPGDRRPICNSNNAGRNTFSPQVLPPSQSPEVHDDNTGNRGFQPARQPPSPQNPLSPSCRQPGERPTVGDRRPLCSVSQRTTSTQRQRPANVPAPSPIVGTQTAGNINCRQPSERPIPGDRRPVCSPQTVSGGGSYVQQSGLQQTQVTGHQGSLQGPSPPSSSQHGAPQIPSPHIPSHQQDSPQLPGAAVPEQPPSTEISIQQRQPGSRQPSRGSFTTRSSITRTGTRIQQSQQTQTNRHPVAPSALGVDDQVPPATEWGEAALSPDNSPIPQIPNVTPGSLARPQSQGRTPRPTPRSPAQPVSARRPGSPAIGNAISTTSITTTSITSDGPRSLYEIVEDPALLIQGRPVKLTKIFELFQKAGLDYILTDPGPYTVFLPSDDAFLRLPKGVIEQLESDPNLLQQVLLFHVTTAEVLPSRQDDSFFVPSFQGTPLLITMLKGGRLILISGAKAVAVTRANNGIFYVVNQLIYPLPQEDIVSALNSRPDLTTITSFIEISGLREVFGDQPYTLFAPTDNAFNQLSESAMQELTQNTTALRELLMGHIIPGAHYGREFLNGPVFSNMRGGNLKLNTVSFGYQVNDVNIKTPEIVTGGGVIHIIDEVLLTPEDSRYIERLTNTLEGIADPPSGPERQTPAHGSNPSAQQPATTGTGTTGWRSHSVFSVSFGHTTTTRGQGAGAGSQSFRPASEPQIQPAVRNTFVQPGSVTHTSTIQQQQIGRLISNSNDGSQPQGEEVRAVPENEAPAPDSGSSLTGTQPSNPASGQFSVHQASGSFFNVPTSNDGRQNQPANFGHYDGVVQLANDIGLRQFATLLSNSGLSDKIQDGGTYTVFAPTDEALNSLPADVLYSDPNQLRNLLEYHILPQKLSSSSVGNDETASTLLEGKKLRINKYNNGQILTALGVPVDPREDDSSSIRLIPVNQVLQPPPGNLLKIVENSPYLTEFYNAIKKYHLNWMLNGESGLTLFAPSDTAFQSLTEEQRKELIDNRQNFTNLVKSHLIRGTVYTSGVQDGEQRRTQNRKSVTFNLTDGGVTVNSVPISQPDVPATNGVLHIVDQFL